MTKLGKLNRTMHAHERAGTISEDEYATYRTLLGYVQATEEVLRISDRKHDAWDAAKAALAKLEELES